MRSAAIALALLGCHPDGDTDAGTIVGNPGDGMVVVAPSDEITYIEAAGYLNHVEFVACDDETMEHVDVDDEVDMLDPLVLPFPSGRWCELNMEWDGELYFSGDGVDNNDFEAILEVYEVLTFGDFTIEEDGAYITEIGFPDWLSAVALGMVADETTYIEIGDDLHEDLVGKVEGHCATFADADLDGELSEDEREAGPITAGEDREDQPPPPEEEEEGVTTSKTKGCRQSGASWLVFLPLVWFRRRKD